MSNTNTTEPNWLVLREWELAEASGRRRLALEPDDLAARTDLVEALHRQGRYSEALELAEPGCRALHLELLLARANALAELDDLEMALWAYVETLSVAENQPETAATALVIAKTLSAVGEKELASVWAHKAVVLDSSVAEAVTLLGSLLLGSDPVLAERRLRHSLRLDPEQPAALHDLGVALFRQNRLDEAMLVLKVASRLSPRFVAVKTLLSAVLMKQRQGSPSMKALLMVTVVSSALQIWACQQYIQNKHFNWPLFVIGVVAVVLAHILSNIEQRHQTSALIRADPELGELLAQLKSANRRGEVDRRSAPALKLMANAMGALGWLFFIGAVGVEALIVHDLKLKGTSDWQPIALMHLAPVFCIVGGAIFLIEQHKLADAARRGFNERS